MRKIILTLAAAVFTTTAFAQFTWGFKTGLNIATLDASPYTTLKTSMYFGALGEWRLGRVVAIQPELLYSAQGGSSVTVVGDVTTRAKIRANYALLPVLAKFFVTRTLSIEIGPQAGYVLAAKRYTKIIDKSGGSRAVTRHKERLNSSTFNDFEASIAGGVSYRLTRGFAVSARYSYGLTDFATDRGWRNSVIQVGFASKL